MPRQAHSDRISKGRMSMAERAFLLFLRLNIALVTIPLLVLQRVVKNRYHSYDTRQYQHANVDGVLCSIGGSNLC